MRKGTTSDLESCAIPPQRTYAKLSATLLVQHYYMYAYLANRHLRIAEFPPERSRDLILIP